MTDAYLQFLKNKIAKAPCDGFEPESPPHPSLFGHQRDVALWAARGGRRAVFANFGLGKTRINLQLAKWVTEHSGGRYLIVAPLGVRGEFCNYDGPAMGIVPEYVRTDAEVKKSTNPVLISNYERLRDGDISPEQFDGVGLDEAAILRGFGTKTYQSFLKMFRDTKYKFVFTATPSPNRYKELIHYSGFLSILDTGDCLTRFFQRDSQQAGNLTLMPHMADAFWYWLSTWACFLQKPSDLGYSDKGYELPPFTVHWHRILEDYRNSWTDADSWGQFQLLPSQAQGLRKAAASKRNTIKLRVARAMDIIRLLKTPTGFSDQFIVWCDLNSEQDEMERALKKAGVKFTSLRGSQSIDLRESLMEDWKEKRTTGFVSKCMMYGAGINMQQCATMIYLGVGYKFNDFIQGFHRIVRFLQTKEAKIYIIYLESEDKIKDTLQAKWRNHDELMKRMSAMVREHKLANINL